MTMTTTFAPNPTFDPVPSPFPPSVPAAKSCLGNGPVAGLRGPATGSHLQPAAWKHISSSVRAFLARKRADARLRWALSAPATFGPGHLLLGSPATPWEALPGRHSLLRALSCPPKGEPAGAERLLAVTLRCATEGEQAGGVANDLELLRRLDLDHAITVEWELGESLLESGAGGEDPLAPVLRAARTLAGAGIETRLRLRGSAPTTSSLELEGLFARACEVGIADVVAAAGARPSSGERQGGAAFSIARRFATLRLRYGFPRALPGRG